LSINHSISDTRIVWPSFEEIWRVITLEDYNTRVVVLGVMALGTASGLVGTFLLLRKRALTADALSHATLPGIAVAFMVMVALGGDGKSLMGLLLGAFVFGCIGVLAILGIRHTTRLKDDAGKHKNLYDLAVASQKELIKFDKEFADLKKAKTAAKRDKAKIKKLEDDFAKLWPPYGKGQRGWKASTGRAKGWGGVGELTKSGRPTLGRDLGKVLDKGKQPKELQTKLSVANKVFTDKVDGEFKDNAKAVWDNLNAVFDSSGQYKLEFVNEAATGNYKFGAGSKQAAHHMLSWSPAGNVADFKIHMYDLKSQGSSSPIIAKYAKQMNLEVNWKSSSTHKHKGYNVYQNIRIGMGKLMEETDHEFNMLYEEYDKLTEQLDEGTLAEWKFFDKVKDMATNFVATIKELASKILDFFKEAVEKIKDAAKDGIQALGAVLGFEMDVNDTLRRTLKSQMKDANKMNAKYVVILGESELANNHIIIKNMETGYQDTINFMDIQKYFK